MLSCFRPLSFVPHLSQLTKVDLGFVSVAITNEGPVTKVRRDCATALDGLISIEGPRVTVGEVRSMILMLAEAFLMVLIGLERSAKIGGCCTGDGATGVDPADEMSPPSPSLSIAESSMNGLRRRTGVRVDGTGGGMSWNSLRRTGSEGLMMMPRCLKPQVNPTDKDGQKQRAMNEREVRDRLTLDDVKYQRCLHTRRRGSIEHDGDTQPTP